MEPQKPSPSPSPCCPAPLHALSVSASSDGADGLTATTGDRAPAKSCAEWLEGSLRHHRKCLKALGDLLRRAPWVAVIPCLVFAMLTLAGELGLSYAVSANKSERRHLAQSTVDSTAGAVALQLQRLSAPTVAAAASVRALPYVPDLAPRFPDIAASILAKLDPTSSVLRTHIIPWGVVVGVYPYNTPCNLGIMGHNFYTDPARSAVNIELTERGPDYLDILGPIETLEGASAFLSRMALFLPSLDINTTWGMDTSFTVPYAPGLQLGQATRPSLGPCGAACGPIMGSGSGPPLVFWGMIRTAVRSTTLMALLSRLEQQPEQYKYILYRVKDSKLHDRTVEASPVSTCAAGTTVLISNSSMGPSISAADSPACSLVEAGSGINITWALCIAPRGGWDPPWAVCLHILLPFLSLLVAGLLFGILVGRKQYQQLVQCMLPAKAISKLRDGGDYVEPFRNVTVLFSDIVSYTSLSSQLPPCKVVKLLTRMFQHFDGLVDRHNIYKVDTIGDGFMAIAGAPDPCHPRDAAVRLARMALDMIEFTRGFECDGRNVEIRVGMYTGDVTAAVIGSKMPHWTILGDTVNVASRMESHSLAMHVQVGHTTARLLAGVPEFELQPRGLIQIKGKGMMPTYFLERARGSSAGEEKQEERPPNAVRQDAARTCWLLMSNASSGPGDATKSEDEAPASAATAATAATAPEQAAAALDELDGLDVKAALEAGVRDMRDEACWACLA